MKRICRHGFRFFLDSAEADWLVPRVIDRLDELRDLPGVTVIKENQVRTVIRVPLDEAVLYVKRYHVRGLRERLKYLAVRSRAVTEWRAARTMVERGLPAVRAIMMGEKRTAGILRDGWFATVEIPDSLDFVPYLDRNLLAPEWSADRVRLLLDLMRLVRRFHDLGFSHSDLHSGNILVTGGPGESALHLVDLHNVGIRGRVSSRRRLTNISKLLHSLILRTDESERRVLLDTYEGDDPVLGEREVTYEAVERGIASLETRRLFSRSKRCMRNSSAFRPSRAGTYRVHARREIAEWAPLLVIGDHLLSVAHGGREVLKDSTRSALSRQVLPGQIEYARVVVKETRCRGAIELLKNAVRPPRAQASWLNGNGLRVRKVGVALPLALVVNGAWPIRRESFLIMEDLADFERLDIFVLHRYAGRLSREQRERKLRLTRAFGRFLGGLHHRGIYHGDMKAVNIFVRFGRDSEPEFRLVDYDRVHFGRRVGIRRRIKNLAQLAASVAVLISKTDRLRFFLAYAPDDAALKEIREYARGVEAECRKKIVVTMEPIE